MPKPLAVYIHIPFCARKCVYCDFPSYAGQMQKKSVYLKALFSEMRKMRQDDPVKTVYIGGGTPSLLTPSELTDLFSALRESFSLAEDAEISMEANPGAVTSRFLQTARALGVNRISFGAQAKQDGILKTLGRIHRWDAVIESVSAARDAGFDNLNLDLMYALPGQTASDWRETLESALELRPTHFSLYSLILEDGTPLKAAVSAGQIRLPGEDALLKMQETASALLTEYPRYEISNYAKPGFECRHNLVYWRRGNYLGLGCGAHSMIDDVRFFNSSDLDVYISGDFSRNETVLSEKEIREETLMLGTRLTEGVDFPELNERKRPMLERFQTLGLLSWDGRRIRLTDRGMDVQNAILVELLTP